MSSEGLAVKLHLVDGTYELFRSHFGAPPTSAPDGRPMGAVRGLVQTLLSLLRQPDVTHVACAFDHVVESFRNDMFSGYKTGEGVPADLMQQFGPAEEAVSALGMVVWPMVEFEADDAIATAVLRWAGAGEVDQTVICSPDKDLTQLVDGDRIVCLDRRRGVVLNESGVRLKFGVSPASIPDFLALVGAAAAGIPGIPRWGAKSAAAVLSRYGQIEKIPLGVPWEVEVRGAATMVANLSDRWDDALLYKRLTTLRSDVPISEGLADLRWRGAPRRRYLEMCAALGFDRLVDIPHRWDDGG